MTSVWYDRAKIGMATGLLNLATDPLWIMLLDGTYVSNPVHSTLADITGEVVGAGYTEGGQTLTGQTITIKLVPISTTAPPTPPQTERLACFSAAPSTWVNATIKASGFVIYKKGATPATSPLLCCVAFTEEKGVENLNITLSCDRASGFLCY